MVNKHKQRSKETRKIILTAAGKLFASKGYDAVTMREIAKEANCSHTTIYLYFKDKQSLLHHLSMPPLLELHDKLKEIAMMDSFSPEEKLKEISREFIYFCLYHKNIYRVLINEKSLKVDETEPESELNRLRVKLFAILRQAIGQCLSIPDNDELLAYSRIFFYNLYGVLSTYSYQHESTDALMARLSPTFELAVSVLILGFKEKIKENEEKQ
ncbi:TetR/AcrR family transcriptional regulator [Oceanobacillus salinisoli]|uniref:TetR/AcrR family transcriptional regulator n=1 Tax=Oceanobacillus salinisoli TaxID=2678611 RepID=UPI0012E2DDCC|nr:TetR/AcrR family transcriptional regulator [Oceanobacillus salinisoli]